MKKINKLNKTILNSIEDFILVYDEQARLVKSNKAFKNFFQDTKSFNQIIQNKELLLKLIPHKQNNSYINSYDITKWQDILLNQDKNHELFIQKNEKEYYFKISANKVYNDSSEYNYTVITLTDITKIKRLKTKHINQIKLESIGKLVAGITHEINTPLTFMRNNLELLELDLEDLDKENLPIKDLLNNIKEGINRIANIVEATNEIVKKDSNQKIKYNLYTTLVYAIRLVHNHSKHQMPIYINNELFNINVDRNKLLFEASIIKEKIEQVWIILLNNAYDEFVKSPKAFENRSLHIDIIQLQNHTKIRFKDNANKGIDESILNVIFDPFISTKDYSGIGLGLNIAQKIIEEHKGEITAYNEDNNAVFEVTLQN